MQYKVKLTGKAKQLLTEIKDRREQRLLLARIRRLTDNPEQQGKPLRDELAGYRSIRAVGQRYRVIYRIEERSVIVVVAAIGRRKEGDRKDVYKIAQKLVDNLQTEQLSDDDLVE